MDDKKTDLQKLNQLLGLSLDGEPDDEQLSAMGKEFKDIKASSRRVMQKAQSALATARRKLYEDLPDTRSW